MKIIAILMLLLSISSGQRGRGRGFASSLFGHMHQAGSRLMQSVQNGMEEAGKVAQVLAGDATDAIKTAATARIDDYIPDLEEDMNFLQKRQNQIQYRQQQQPSSLVSSLLRMVGFDEHKLGMMALNVLVYLAEYLAKNMLGMDSELSNEIPQYRSLVQEEGMMAGMFKMVGDANAKSHRIRQELLAPELSGEMINMVPGSILGADTSCIQMFLCKVEPAFWSAQTTSRNYEGLSLRRSMASNFQSWLEVVYQNLPNLKTLRQIGDRRRCKEKFPKCQLLNSF